VTAAGGPPYAAEHGVERVGFIGHRAVHGAAERDQAGVDPGGHGPPFGLQGGQVREARVPGRGGVTYDGNVTEELLRRLAELLPDVIGEAVECPEEPLTGPAGPGDIEIRFREKSQLDVGDLDVVIEIRTKLFGHRVQDKQRRADLIRDRLSGLSLGQVGVWLILAEGAWSQSEAQRRG
jgi:hypothetical protein